MGEILSLGEAVQKRQAAQEQGLRVVFTNGVFDLLHLGHVRYLQAAREMGDMLIIGLNSDASTH